jgi:hypothetical protein
VPCWSRHSAVMVNGDKWTNGQLAILSIFQFTVLGLYFAAWTGLAPWAGGGILEVENSPLAGASDLGRALDA